MKPESNSEVSLPDRPDGEEYETILRSLSAGVCRLDGEGRVLYFNDAAAAMLGRDAASVIGKRYPKLFFGDGVSDSDPRCAPIQFTLEENEVSHVNNEHLVRPDGTECLVELICVPLLRDGSSPGAVVSFINVADLRDVEDAVSRAREDALQAAKSKAEFLANMSHEIRTPLTGIVGTVDLLSRTDLSAEQREFLEMLRASTEFLHGIVNNILDFSRIEAGKFQPRVEPFSLSDLGSRSLDLIRSVAAKKDLSLKYELDDSLPKTVTGDAGSIQQVVNNLLNNAVKFTDTGSIGLRIIRAKRDGYVRFLVSDTGIGIAENDQVELFSPFSQVDSSDIRRHEGTGLGLSISRRLVEFMNGEVGLESEEGSGTTVWFEIPLSAADDLRGFESAPPERLRTRALAVLVVDDNPINMKVLQKMLSGLGVLSDTAVSGPKAIAACAQKPYDIVFMDCQMPEMDGFEAAAKIKAGGPRSPWIIAFTASTADRDMGRIRESGMDAILRKPFTEQDLVNVINSNPRLSKGNKILDLDSDIGEHSLSKFIDSDSLLRLSSVETKDTRGFLTEILEIFEGHTAAGLAELAGFVKALDREKIAKKAHNLKGSSGNIGIGRLAGLFEELEDRSILGDKEELNTILHTIRDEFEAVSNAIKHNNEEYPNDA